MLELINNIDKECYFIKSINYEKIIKIEITELIENKYYIEKSSHNLNLDFI